MELHNTATRPEIATGHDGEYNPAKWNVGCVTTDDGSLALFVTLDKTTGYFADEHDYSDGFNSPTRIRYSSQNRTKQTSPVGKKLTGEVSADLHVYVRPAKKIKGVTQPFTYFGTAKPAKVRGDQPITCWLELDTEVPPALRSLFHVPTAK